MTGDRSAFDVYVSFSSADNKKGFIAIEVKYHENLIGAASPHKDRYNQIADQMGCFKESIRKSLHRQLYVGPGESERSRTGNRPDPPCGPYRSKRDGRTIVESLGYN